MSATANRFGLSDTQAGALEATGNFALTAGAGRWTADAVARVTLKGIRNGSFSVTPGLPLTALSWFHSLCAPLLRRHFDRIAARAKP